jgi:neuron navigator 2
MRAPASTHTLAHAISETHGHSHAGHALTSRNPTSTFGFKKQGLVTMVTASGATITSGSATLGKMPKSGGGRSLMAGLKAGGGGGGGGGATDGVSALGLHHHHDDGYLPLSARSTLQYRSLPRPSRSGGAGARHGNRASTSSIEVAVLSVTSHGKAGAGVAKGNGAAGGGGLLLLANQTDREKGVSDVDGLRGGPGMGGRQQVSSPTLRR